MHLLVAIRTSYVTRLLKRRDHTAVKIVLTMAIEVDADDPWNFHTGVTILGSAEDPLAPSVEYLEYQQQLALKQDPSAAM